MFIYRVTESLEKNYTMAMAGRKLSSLFCRSFSSGSSSSSLLSRGTILLHLRDDLDTTICLLYLVFFFVNLICRSVRIAGFEFRERGYLCFDLMSLENARSAFSFGVIKEKWRKKNRSIVV